MLRFFQWICVGEFVESLDWLKGNAYRKTLHLCGLEILQANYTWVGNSIGKLGKLYIHVWENRKFPLDFLPQTNPVIHGSELKLSPGKNMSDFWAEMENLPHPTIPGRLDVCVLQGETYHQLIIS